MFLHELLTVLFCEWCSNTRHIKANMSPKYSFVYVYWSGYLSPCMWTVFADDQRFISLTMFFFSQFKFDGKIVLLLFYYWSSGRYIFNKCYGSTYAVSSPKVCCDLCVMTYKKAKRIPTDFEIRWKKVVNQFGPWLLKWLDTSAEVVLITFRRYGILIRAIWVYK